MLYSCENGLEPSSSSSLLLLLLETLELRARRVGMGGGGATATSGFVLGEPRLLGGLLHTVAADCDVREDVCDDEAAKVCASGTSSPSSLCDVGWVGSRAGDDVFAAEGRRSRASSFTFS